MSNIPHDHVHDDMEPLSPRQSRTNPPLTPQSTIPSPKPIRIAIIGGGIGGLALAVGLLKHPNIDVQVYEAAHQFSEIGAGLGLGPNAQKALAKIGPGAEQAYLSQATYNQWAEYKSTWIQVRQADGEGAGTLLAAPDNRTGQVSVHRAHFLDELVKLVPTERTHFGKRLVQIHDRTNEGGSITLEFKDGTTAEADAVIGADGVHSKVREHLLGKEHAQLNPQYSGAVAYRGLVPIEKAKAAVGDELALNSVFWVGKGAAMITYPIDFATTFNIVGFTWQHPEWKNEKWALESSIEQASKDFGGFGEQCSKLVGLLDKPLQWSLWDYPPAPFFNKSRICMMGDAAHATTPFLGAGAGQAIEDAMVLDQVLGHARDVQDISHAFAGYDAIRRPRSQALVKASFEAGQLVSLQHPDVGEDLEKLKGKVGDYEWLWFKDMDEQAEEAVTAMRSSRGE